MFKNGSLMTTLVVGIITTLFGFLLGFWYNQIYDQPEIEYYSRPYYKIADNAIGNVYLFNNGRKVDKNIAVTFFANIDPKDFKIVDYTSNYQIKNNDNKTTVVLEELKPQEGADITFKANPKDDDVMMDVVSYGGKISNGYEEKWWHFPLITQIVIILSSILIGFSVGLFIIKIYPRIARKK